MLEELKDDAKDDAEAQSIMASTINAYLTNGFTAESSVEAVMSGDPAKLVHTGKTSVQLHDPADVPPEGDTTGDDDEGSDGPPPPGDDETNETGEE